MRAARIMHPDAKTVLRILAALACLAAAACARREALGEKVDAGGYVNYSMWRSEAAGRLSPRQLADLDEAVQEIRFRVMAEGRASGSAAVDDAMFQRINGLTVRQVLASGFGLQLQRALAEESALEVSISRNSLMRTRPGDTASANYLSDLSDRQAARLKAAADQVSHARERLAAAGVAAEPAAAPAGAAGTQTLPADSPPARIN
jgi:hypothetical protein